MRYFNAEKVVIDFLLSQVEAGVFVGKRVPEKAKTFIKVLRTGGTTKGAVTDVPILVIECYASIDTDAQALAEDVRELLTLMHLSATTGTTVYRVAVSSGPAELPDPHHSSHRYSMTVSIQLRGTRSTRSLK